MSQYDSSIHPKLQSSACGPVTAYVLLNYMQPDTYSYQVNELYKLLGGTRIGLFTGRFLRKMRRLLGPTWCISKCNVHDAIKQIDEGRPVALKYDRYFAFRRKGTFTFSYHWVPCIGYEKVKDEIFLFIHDNGGRNRESVIRRVSYQENAPILTFVKFVPPAS